MNRFDALYSAILPGKPLWDVGCDHGLVGLRALQEDRVPFVNFVDISAAAIDSLTTRLPTDLAPRSQIRLTRGQDLPWNEVAGTVVLAGLGPATIRSIVDVIPLASRSRLQLVMSSEKNSDELRSWLDENGWRLVAGSEAICRERGRFRLVFAVRYEEGERLRPFGNSIFESFDGMEYLNSLIELWRGSQVKQSKWPANFRHLLDLETEYKGKLS